MNILILGNSEGTMRSLLLAIPCRWINSWEAYQFHPEKPLQLHKAKQIGVKIPATWIENDASQAIAFVQSQ